MKVSITEDCVACERCVELCPEVFEMGGTYAQSKVDIVPPEYEDAASEAAEECPVAAIIITE
jgi:ferredoxin